ncbi:MAG TPA: MoaF C-terminal domain-containing protein [Dehalococcoidales bacterium]|nr:MoaF C-terminal domain-containing protein [Dehalococcoidales bacterium]
MDSNSLVRSDYHKFKSRPYDTQSYVAMRVAPQIYFVDFVIKPVTNVSVSMALDPDTGRATVVKATIPDIQNIEFSFRQRLGKDADLISIQLEINHAVIGHFSPDEPVPSHPRTMDLIGKRIKYTYGHDRVYEHIYLNERFYAWHCLKGAEAGLGDTDISDYFKVAPDIYLFIWREKIMPTFGLVLINLRDMRSNGKTFGLDIAAGQYLNFTMGAVAELLNETRY